METGPRSTDFVALGQPGDRYAGLETFANPGVSHVEMTSDELTPSAPSPVSLTCTLRTSGYWPGGLCIESRRVGCVNAIPLQMRR